MTALHHVFALPRHVVAQVIEAEFIVRAVGDVGGVLLAAHRRSLPAHDASGGHTESAEHPPHQLGLVAREVVVDGDHVHATRRDCIEVRRSCGDQGLSLARLHLGDVAEMQCRAAHELHVEVAQAQGALRRLANGRERFGEQIVERFPSGVPLAQLYRLVLQLLIGDRGEVVFEVIDRLRVALKLAQGTTLADAENAFQNICHR